MTEPPAVTLLDLVRIDGGAAVLASLTFHAVHLQVDSTQGAGHVR
jgi:hypothetical protein